MEFAFEEGALVVGAGVNWKWPGWLVFALDRVHEGADRRIDRFQEGIHDVWNAVSIRLILRCRNRRGGTLGSGVGSVFVSVTGSFSFG